MILLSQGKISKGIEFEDVLSQRLIVRIYIIILGQVRLNMGSGRRGLFTLGLANRANAPSTLSSGIGSRWARHTMEIILKS